MWIDSEIERAVLSDPVLKGCNELKVLSGYASPSVVHALLALDSSKGLSVDLTVGMVVQDGISLGAHRGFIALQSVHYPGRVRVGYIIDGQAVHTKLYVWCRDGEPRVAFAGSANFTANGLQGGYRELMVPADPAQSLELVKSVAASAVPCDDSRVTSDFVVLDSRRAQAIAGVLPQYQPWISRNYGYIDISLLNSKTKTGVAYGLNWGQRPKRDPNQSYLPVPAVVARSGMLPPRGKRFTLLSADGQALSAVVAQDGDKAIETPDSNAILGKFIRAMIGMPSGSKIDAEDLRRANATGYRLYRVDDETFAIEFGNFG